ncbi:MAG TPA: MFS transporter [Bryobacteraceae bacterium]|nr:MFS transporter [Bryobacteraceae bacterium]
MTSNRVGQARSLPAASQAALIKAMQFPEGDHSDLSQPDLPWRELLDFADRSSLTLLFGEAARSALPEWVRDRIAQNLAENTERLERVRALQEQVDAWLTAAGLPYIFLKGTTQSPHFVSDPRLRAQHDLDLFCPLPDARRAWELLIDRGYEPIEKRHAHPTDHLPALILKTGWEWHGGSYFDPEIPLAIEVHYQFWDEVTERLRLPGLDEFWIRRRGHALDTVDALGYAALHLLRHLLRGSVRACHVYELASFLERHASDALFWNSWRDLHAPELRRLEAIAFCLSRAWFACALGPVAGTEVAALPPRITEWFETFAFSPLDSELHPNKDELWLHLALLDSTRDKLAVARRRVLPTLLPGPVDAVCIPRNELTLGRRILKYARTARFLGRRTIFHLRAFSALLQSGFHWRMRSSGLTAGFWLFLGSSSFFVLGMFIFVLLYNLYLLDLGFREDFVGQVSSASTAGMVVAILPSAALARRWGLGKLLLVSFAAVGLISAARLLPVGRTPLLALAFLHGIAFSLYAVALAPAIARLTSDQSRASGFSISTTISISLGIFGNWLGGHLPHLLGGKRPAMLAACGLVGAALWPAARLRIGPAPAEGAKLYPRNRFVVQFLMVWAVWNLATGAFNPFFATFFASLHTPVEKIGLILSGSQLAQVGALTLAPVILRKMGLVSGTAAMLLATALALGGLASGPVGWATIAVFMAYTSCQWMSEPGVNTLLMDRVRDQERTGASALMMLVAFGAQFIASFAGGAAIAKFGYSAMLACAAGLAAIAAVAFRALPGERTELVTAPLRLPQSSPPDTAPG